jgi:hypothetical protein
VTQETAFNLTLVVIAITTIALIISEVRVNLLRERAKDRERAEQEPAASEGEAYQDVLNPPPASQG